MEKEKYLFYGQTTSLCEECLRLIPAKIILQNGSVYYLKFCPEHKYQRTLISTDISYFRRCKEKLTPSYLPSEFKTPIAIGCPFDCGLCPDHEQHTAMGIVEILDECNLKCPTCIAASHPGAGNIRTIDEVDRMLETLVKHETSPDLVMISGGEPTIHPSITEILKLAKSKPIKHVMLISNGVRIANDPTFVDELKQIRDNFEVYLQFDSLTPEVLANIRGENLIDIRIRAINNLEAAGIHSTLVCVVKKSLNEFEMNSVIEFALGHKYIRGVTFQPCKITGRNESFDKDSNYITLSEVRRNILKDSKFFTNRDLIPHPLNRENICIGYLQKNNTGVTAVTKRLFRKKNASFSSSMYFLPIHDSEEFKYSELFRVAIVSFLDKFNFCTTAVKRSCIHFLTAKEEIIPIDTYYLLYQQADLVSRPLVPITQITR